MVGRYGGLVSMMYVFIDTPNFYSFHLLKKMDNTDAAV